jgi:hypothetical protein
MRASILEAWLYRQPGRQDRRAVTSTNSIRTHSPFTNERRGLSSSTVEVTSAAGRTNAVV